MSGVGGYLSGVRGGALAVRLLYQAYSFQSQTVETCIIPADDQLYLSTNLP